MNAENKSPEQQALEQQEAALELLQEINDDAVIEDIDFCASSLHNIEAEESSNKKSPAKQYFLVQAAKDKKLPSHELVRQKKINLKRNVALSDNSALLLSIIPDSEKKLIIPFMTNAYTNTLQRTKSIIQLKIEKLLRPLIPNQIKVTRAMHGGRPFIKHPGFMWICGEEFGNMKIWVTPDIPYYFEQFTEMDVLKKHYPAEKLRYIDNIINKYLRAFSALRKREAKLAMRLEYVNTYEDLINFNVECAELLIARANMTKAEK